MAMWVFGYGSLLWNPGFEVAEQQIARLPGYARSFCMLSVHHRGTETDPGLVLALDEVPEASCLGVALRVQPGHEEATLQYLRERELVSSAYYETKLSVTLQTGPQVDALCYVVDRAHRQYCHYSLEQQAQIIAFAHGGRGPNSEYLINTAKHLTDLGIEDEDLSWLAARVAALTA